MAGHNPFHPQVDVRDRHRHPGREGKRDLGEAQFRKHVPNMKFLEKLAQKHANVTQASTRSSQSDVQDTAQNVKNGQKDETTRSEKGGLSTT